MTYGWLLAVAGFLADKPAGGAVSLQEAVDVGTQVQAKLDLRIQGKIQTGKEEAALAGRAILEYDDRVMALGPDKLAKKSIRYYNDGRAKFVVGNAGDPRQLRSVIRTMVAEHEKARQTIWSPSGPLTNDERELVEDVLDTSRLAGLLPKDSVKQGDTWKPDPDVMQSLCSLEHFLAAEVDAKLESVNEDEAQIVVAGKVSGVHHGADVKIELNAKVKFNRRTNLVDNVDWRQKDARAISPVSPAGTFDVQITVTRMRTESERLSDAVLGNSKFEPNPASKMILYNDPLGRFRFFHDREWNITGMKPDAVVMRRMNGGEFICQLNVQLIENKQPGPVKAEDFQSLIEQMADIKIEEIGRVDNLPTDGTFTLHQVVARGKSGQVPVAQKHFLASSNSGRQVVFSFLTDPNKEEKLGTVDLSTVSTLEFLTATASKDGNPKE